MFVFPHSVYASLNVKWLDSLLLLSFCVALRVKLFSLYGKVEMSDSFNSDLVTVL